MSAARPSGEQLSNDLTAITNEIADLTSNITNNYTFYITQLNNVSVSKEQKALAVRTLLANSRAFKQIKEKRDDLERRLTIYQTNAAPNDSEKVVLLNYSLKKASTDYIAAVKFILSVQARATELSSNNNAHTHQASSPPTNNSASNNTKVPTIS